MEPLRWYKIKSDVNASHPELKNILDNHDAQRYAVSLSQFRDALMDELEGQRIPFEDLLKIKKIRMDPYMKNYLKAEKQLVDFIKHSHYATIMKQPASLIKAYYSVGHLF